MGTERHITWENFRNAFIAPGVPAVHPVHHPGRPDIHLFVDSRGARIGMHIHGVGKQHQVLSPLATAQVRLVLVGGDEVLELSTSEMGLYQQFYVLLMDVADRVQLSGRAPAVAIEEALRDWKELLREVPLLTLEAQTGLIGELWMLERLIHAHGPAAVDAWVGPSGEPHDFRIGNYEFEVKTTRMLERVHVINGLHQLVPSSGQQLFILSLQFGPGGHKAGETLPGMIARLRQHLGADASKLGRFNAGLASLGYRDVDAERYPAQMLLRTSPALIPVDDDCPRLTQDNVRSALGSSFAERIRDVHYRVDLSGLGCLDGTPDFLSILP